MWTVRVPCSTANMGSGFDCMGMALEIYNEVDFEFTRSGLVVELDDCDKGFIPTDSRNLIYRTFDSVMRKERKRLPGLYIRQRNNIPNMRGLGSSAACVAAAVIMANCALDGRIPFEKQIYYGSLLEGHPDNILPAMLGGITIGAINDKQVIYQQLDPPDNLECAVIVPSFVLPTRKSRAVLPRYVPMRDAVFNISRAAILTAGIAKGDISVFEYALCDRLHEQYRKALVPDYDEVISICRESGAIGACLSGAGPAVIAYLKVGGDFCASAEKKLASLPNSWSVQSVKISRKGAILSEITG